MKRSVKLAREKTDRTVHRTVSYRIYGANFQNTVKTVLTIPYRITVHRTVHRTATALMMSHNTSLLPYSPPAGTGACPSAGASPGHLQKSCHWGGQKRWSKWAHGAVAHGAMAHELMRQFTNECVGHACQGLTKELALWATSNHLMLHLLHSHV